MAVKIQLRRDTAAAWTSANPTLAQGELGLETDTTYYKIGDGATAWNSLAYGSIVGTLVDDSVTTSKILDANVTEAKLAANAVTTNKILDANVTTAKLADKSVTSAKLGPLTSSGVGASWTFALVNAESVISYTGAGAATATIPPESSVAFPNGTQLNVIQYGGGQVTFTAGAGVTINSEGSKFKTKAQWAIATAIKIDTNFWVVVGNLAA